MFLLLIYTVLFHPWVSSFFLYECTVLCWANINGVEKKKKKKKKKQL